MIISLNVLQENKKMNNNPLHGKTLKDIVEQLVDFYGFDTLAELINIKCFKENPSVKSSLTFFDLAHIIIT